MRRMRAHLLVAAAVTGVVAVGLTVAEASPAAATAPTAASTVQISTVQISTVQSSTVQSSTVQSSTVQSSTAQSSTAQVATVHDNARAMSAKVAATDPVTARTGRFELTGAPILPEDAPPDGLACYLGLGSCRAGVLHPAGLSAADPQPVALTRVGGDLVIRCQLGNWLKIYFPRPGQPTSGAGWVAADAVRTMRTPHECLPFVEF